MDTQVKQKRKRVKHEVEILCTRCRKPFKSRTYAHLCHNCRPKNSSKPQQNQQQKPQTKPKPNKKPKPLKPLRQPQGDYPDLRVSNSSRIANRTTRTSAPLRAGRGSITNAVQRLVLAMLDPAGTVGQRAVRLNIDNIAAPKYPVQFDNNFTIYGESFKLMLCSSPMIIATVYHKGVVQVEGAESYTVSVGDGFYTYVLGNKRKLITEEVAPLAVESKEDFRQFRMIGSSMMIQWAGQEIFKNGVYNIARITDNENLATFNPNTKIDSVVANISDVVTCTSQRVTATAPLIDVDPNNSNAGGVRPEGGKKIATEHMIIAGGLPGPLDFGTKVFTFQTISTFVQLATYLSGEMNNFYNANSEFSRLFDTFISKCVAKYPEFWNAESNSYNCKVIAEWNLTVTISTGVFQTLVFTTETQGLIVPGNSRFFIVLTPLIASLASTSAMNVPPGNRSVVTRLNLSFVIPVDGKINQRVMIPNFLNLGVDENSLADTVFYDDGFLEPVVSAQGSGLGMQVTTTHLYEFLLSDDTILAAAAVANTPKDPEAVISQQQYDRYQKIMKGMPPAIIQGDLGMSRVSTAQLASRGILKDVFSILGPIATSILPNCTNVVNAVGGIIDNL